MTLSTGEKALIVGGAAAVVIGGVAIAVSKAKAPPSPTAEAIILSVTPTSLSSSGGVIAISGTTQNMPADISVSILINGDLIDTILMSGSTFSASYDVSPNTSSTAETLRVEATAA